MWLQKLRVDAAIAGVHALWKPMAPPPLRLYRAHL